MSQSETSCFFCKISDTMQNMQSIYFNIAALCIYILSFYLYYSRSRLYLKQTYLFFIFMFVGSCSTIMYIIVHFLNTKKILCNISTHYFFYIVFFVLQNTVAVCFCIFFIALTAKQKPKTITKACLFSLWLISTILICTTSITHKVFYFDENCNYVQGSLLPFLSTVAFFYAFVCLVTFLLNLKKIPKEAEPAVFSFLFAYLIALITQILLPKLHVQNLCIGFSTLIGLLTIQDFKSYTDYETQLYNKSVFLIQYDLFFKQKSCVLFLINIEAVNFIYSIFGTEVYLALEKQIVTKIFGKPRSDRFGAKISRGKFILALSNTNKIQKEQDALLDTFSNPFIFKDRVFTISAHICKVLIPEDTEDIQNIFQAQNELTRQKKQYAVNTIIPFNQLKITKSARYFEISKKINDALLADGFDVVFQPIVSPTSQKTISAEALVRFHTTNGKFISPAEFIPIAEQTGKIHEIGEIVIHKSCQFMQKLKKEQTDIRFIEINLSPVQCLHPNLSQKILSIVKKYELEPKDICFEITETTTKPYTRSY